MHSLKMRLTISGTVGVVALNLVLGGLIGGVILIWKLAVALWYAGTRELNAALVSRFLVIEMPPLDEATLAFLLRQHFPNLKQEALEQFSGLFLDLQNKASHGEISTKPLDLRGMIAGIRTIRSGLKPANAIRIGVLNKCFDPFEKELLEDAANTRIPADWTRRDVFED